MSMGQNANNAKQRATIAANMIKRQDTFTRAFDDCFEMGDGDVVMNCIIEKASKDPLLAKAILDKKPSLGFGESNVRLHDAIRTCLQFESLAEKLYHQTQIPHQYFEIGNLFLRNISLTEEPNRHQVYAVYRKQDDGSFAQIEALCVNTGSPDSVYASLRRFDALPIKKFTDMISSFNDIVTKDEVEAFKERFAIFEKNY